MIDERKGRVVRVFKGQDARQMLTRVSISVVGLGLVVCLVGWGLSRLFPEVSFKL